MFRCADLETYVTEVDNRKKSILLVNKSDLLTVEQIEEWHKYFLQIGVTAVFWYSVIYLFDKFNF